MITGVELCGSACQALVAVLDLACVLGATKPELHVTLAYSSEGFNDEALGRARAWLQGLDPAA